MLFRSATVNVSKELLQSSNACAAIQALGFTFPFLLRSPGFHIGRYFNFIATEEDLAAAAATLPGETLALIRYLDASSADGKMRKYRVMMIDGQLYPAHLAVARQWKIHYFSADMADRPDHREEEAIFLGDMPGFLGEKAMAGLYAIRDRLGLDYGGIDFGLSPQGDILLFETNAAMVVQQPDPDPRWDYRRTAVSRIHAAVRTMLMKNLVAR